MSKQIETYVIESNIPIPPPARGRGRMSAVESLLNGLLPGQSIVILRGKEQYFRRTAKKAGVDVAVRKVDANTCRLWRV